MMECACVFRWRAVDARQRLVADGAIGRSARSMGAFLPRIDSAYDNLPAIYLLQRFLWYRIVGLLLFYCHWWMAIV